MNQDDLRKNSGIVAGGNIEANVIVGGENNRVEINAERIDQRIRREQPEVARQLETVMAEVRRHEAELENADLVKEELRQLGERLREPKPDAPTLVERLDRLAGMVSHVLAVSAALQPVVNAVRGWL